jgi:acetolactate synthase-1/2/3 large subunit
MARRGADVLVQGLRAAGVTRIFTLSGNHIMEVFDALVGSGIELVHTRHEAAAVHMADAWARLSGQVGVAMVTGGQGHANATAALCSALAGEVPVLLLSGHAPLADIGNGAFQELPQAAMAAPVSKAAWAAQTPQGLAEDVARAFAIALGGRPGPVHLSLPTDVLEAEAEEAPAPGAAAFARVPMRLGAPSALLVAQAVAAAARPLLVAPPALCTPAGFVAMAALEAACGLPVVPMQSPRGLADPSLGAFPEVLAEADLIVLVGKPLDFTLKFGRAPAVAAGCRWIVLEPEGAVVARAQRLVGDRLVFAAVADATEAVAALAGVMRPVAAQSGWADRVRAAVAWRPPEWAGLAPGNHPAPEGAIRSATLSHAVNAAVAARDATFVCDGGEIGQWCMAMVRAGTRIVNGVAGAIGVGIPFAIGARAARPAPTLALMGDGSFGFHMAELDTAARHGLPFVAVVGNDSRWNAEHQIQVRDYGANRAHGCDLAPGTRYDLVAVALGGHGENVRAAHELEPALQRAFDSGRPSVVNVVIDGQPAPSLRR